MQPIERPRYSCMLGGALATISSLPGVVPIIHGAQGCGGGLSNAYYLGGHLGSGYCGGVSIPSSNIGEKEVIFGAAKRLETQINSTLEVMKGDLFLVLSACMTDIIGEDIESVIRNIKNPDNVPIRYIDTGGFQGKAYDGYDEVFSALFEDYIPKASKDDKLVNILGQVPGYDPYFRGNLEEIARLLRELGLKVNTFLTPDQSHENILKAGSAALNIVVSPLYGIKAARTAKKVHDIDYLITDLPIGAEATKEFLYSIGSALSLSIKDIKNLVDKEKKNYYGYLDRIADYVADTDTQSYAVVIANGTDAFAYANYLENEIGYIPRYIFITDYLTQDKQELLTSKFDEYDFGQKPELIFEQDTTAIRRYIEQRHPYEESEVYVDRLSPLLVLGSSIDYKLAQEYNGVLLPVSYPVFNIILNKGFTGFRGAAALFESILNTQLTREVKKVV